MKIVLDVSAAISIATAAPGKEWVRKALIEAEEILVPDLYLAEATNAAWKFFHIEGASLQQIQQLAKRSMDLPDHISPATDLWQDALVLAHQLDHPVYDCLYLTLAQQHEAHLLTLDKRLRRLAKKVGITLIPDPENS